MAVLAIIRIRGSRGVHRKGAETMKRLLLSRTHHCVFVQDSPVLRGMLKATKDYVTWGPVKQETIEKILAKRGKKTEAKADAKTAAAGIFTGKKAKELGFEPVFTLHPARGGMEPIKKTYPIGALGFRKDGMDVLLEKMM